MCGADSTKRKLLLLVVAGTGREILFLSFSLTPNASVRVFLGVGVKEMRLGLRTRVSCYDVRFERLWG